MLGQDRRDYQSLRYLQMEVKLGQVKHLDKRFFKLKSLKVANNTEKAYRAVLKSDG